MYEALKSTFIYSSKQGKALKNKQIGKIYIHHGINELGCEMFCILYGLH